MTETSDANIVKLAYAMVVGQHRYHEMYGAVNDKYEKILASQTEGSQDSKIKNQILEKAFEPLELHFENAQRLMEQQGRRTDFAGTALKMIDQDIRPIALIDSNGRIYHANQAAVHEMGFVIGSKIAPSSFENGKTQKLLQYLSNLEKYDIGKIVSIFGLLSANEEGIINFALTKELISDGQVMAQISAIHVGWSNSISKQFQELFDLTPVELEITKAIIAGISLNDLAEKRGRSIGTIRQQTKSLLRKLNLHSQTELVCLYSGFSKFAISGHETKVNYNALDEPLRSKHVLLRPHGRIIEYEIVGGKSARPVLFFPALIGGNTVTKKMFEALRKSNLKLIMVWRPNFSNSGPDHSSDPDNKVDSFKNYANDIEALLDELDITTCPLISHITSAMYGYGVAANSPDRISNIVSVNGIVPTTKGPHVKFLQKSERFAQFLTRHSPKVGRMILHATMVKIDAGYDQEFMNLFFKDSSIDLETVKDEEIKSGFRRAFKTTVRQGYDSFTHELTLITANWQYLLDQTSCPVKLLVAEHNISYPPELIQAYIKDHPSLELEIIPGTGHLLLYQNPDSVFAAVAKSLG